MNTTPRKFPRTMEEAFGPGHRGGIWEQPNPLHRHDKIVLVACAIAGAAAAVVVLVWG
jgi:hypothetical protein